MVLTRGDEVTLHDLPDFLREERAGLDALEIDLPPQGISLEAIEKELILKALEKFDWNQTHAARYLDISRKTLIYRMERHGIRRPQEQPGFQSMKMARPGFFAVCIPMAGEVYALRQNCLI